MNLKLLFAWRYFRAKKSTNAINIIAWISIVAIIIGTAALILVLSVFNGFEGLVKTLYSSFYTDLKVMPASGKTITITEAQLQKLKGLAGIKNFSLVAEEKALLQNGESKCLVYLKGVDENYRYVTGIANSIIRGNYNLGNEDTASLVLGSGIESAVGIQTDRNIFPLTVYLPRKNDSEQLDPMQSISSSAVTASGTFVIQQDFDNKYAITNIGFVKRLMGMGKDEYNGLEIAINDPSDADNMKEKVASIFSDKQYKVQTRYDQNQELYSVMSNEKWIIYAVLSLILVVAAFNMIGALTMLVLEKQKDISVLHAMGGHSGFIQGIFLNEGILLAVIGGILGMLLALLIVYLQVTFKLIPLTGNSFLIDYFPVKLQWGDFVLVGITVFVIAFIAAWLPARKAVSTDFSLRSE
ncbi:MAG: ABC transporter permease [Bacteroidetes bacterium]|nr:ABC transporter permease [Bacteroidota bacterium]